MSERAALTEEAYARIEEAFRVVHKATTAEEKTTHARTIYETLCEARGVALDSGDDGMLALAARFDELAAEARELM